jgi:pyridoxamine 5'-phosphate oxidase
VTAEELALVLKSSWVLLEKGAASRKNPIHTPVVASINANGLPSQRVMVLRSALAQTRMLRFHTDARSPKTAEIGAGGATSVLAYHPGEAIQLRLLGVGSVDANGEEANAAWESSTLFARRCYMSGDAPGTPRAEPSSGLPSWIEGKMPSETQIGPARPNFAILKVEITTIDWLHLANSGHRRAQLDYINGEWTGRWVIP